MRRQMLSSLQFCAIKTTWLPFGTITVDGVAELLEGAASALTPRMQL